MKIGLIVFALGSFIFACLILTIACDQSIAQEPGDVSIVNAYDWGTIYLYPSVFGDRFVKNGEIMSLGSFGSNLVAEMAGSEYALDEMAKARKYKIAGAAIGLASAGIGITGLVMAFREGDDDDGISAFELSLIITGAVCGMFGDGFNKASMSAMNRAVWLYNRDVMSGQLRVATPF